MASGIQLSWTIEGTTELSRKLVGIQTRLTDFSKPLKKISDSLVKSFSGEVFDTEGGSIGVKWAPLTLGTIMEKDSQGYTGGTLERTGAMRRGFRGVVTSDQAVIGNDMDYFKYHQSNKPRHRLPRRVMMKLNENMKQMIVKAFQAYIYANK